MSADLLSLLRARAAAGRPLRVGLIGAGTFGSMFLAQARRLPGLHVLGVADLSPQRARAALARAGWPEAAFAAPSLAAAMSAGSTYVGDDAPALIAAAGLEVIIEATGVPAAGIAHCLLAIDCRRHIVMVNVEADALCGPILARRAAEAGVVYSLAYGDPPALICEQVAWARACGFEVVAAGKGARYLPTYQRSTPDTVWGHYGFSAEQVALGGYSPQVFNSLLDGTRSAIEMAAVANAADLAPQPDGLRFPPCGVDELPSVLRPEAEGGALAHSGTVEVISSLARDGSPVPGDLGQGVFVCVAAPDDDIRRCFAEGGLRTDASGRYTALSRPARLGGMELPISVLRVGLRGEATGAPVAFRGDVACVARADLAEGQALDGAGGYTLHGRLLPAAASLAAGALPIGLAHGLRLRRPVPAGQLLRWDDVLYETTSPAVRMRRLMERTFGA